MARAYIDAEKTAQAASKTLVDLEKDKESSEQVRIKKGIMIKRIYDLAVAADKSQAKIVLTAEEFGLVAQHWS